MNLDLGSLFFRLGIDQSGFRQGLSEAESSLGSTGDKFGEIAKKIGGVLGISLSIGGIVAFAKSAVSELEKVEAETANYNQVLKNLGLTATMTNFELQKMATADSEMTRYQSAAVQGAEAVLLRYKEIGSDIFPQALKTTIDLAEKMGGGEGSLASAANYLGRALADPTTASRSLRMANVALSEEQKESIKNFMKLGDVASAQKIVLDILTGAVGGLATHLGSVTTTTSQLSKAWHEMLAETGKQIAPDVGATANTLTRLYQSITEAAKFHEWAAADYQKKGDVYPWVTAMEQDTGGEEWNRYKDYLQLKAASDKGESDYQKQWLDWYAKYKAGLDYETKSKQEALEYSQLMLDLQKQTTHEIENQRVAWSPSEEKVKFKGKDDQAWEDLYGSAAQAEAKKWWDEYGKGAQAAEEKLKNVVITQKEADEMMIYGLTKVGEKMHDFDKEKVPQFLNVDKEEMKALKAEALLTADAVAKFGGAFVDAALAGKDWLNVLLNALRSFVTQAIQEWLRLKIVSMSAWGQIVGGSGGGGGAILGGGGSGGYALSGAMVSGGAMMNVSIIDQRDASAPPVTVERGTGANGAQTVKVFIHSIVKDGFDNGAFDPNLRKNFRLSRVGKAA